MSIEAARPRKARRPRVPSHFFVFVVVVHDGHVLLVREAKHGQLWYCPAGGMEPGETIEAAALRETQEEAGVTVAPAGLLRVEQQWFPNPHVADGDAGLSSWWRFVLRANVVGDPSPKSWADEHSLEARWVRPAEIPRLALRHPEVIELVRLALGPAPAVPLVPLVA
ncbi:MAG: NUDIX domain-containing protein [Deltaproteobacteria bacterium]|nr:NUDIX domain-containing protein [Deltaproteobacteria bacterium]